VVVDVDGTETQSPCPKTHQLERFVCFLSRGMGKTVLPETGEGLQEPAGSSKRHATKMLMLILLHPCLIKAKLTLHCQLVKFKKILCHLLSIELKA
jgi:hypothetical protein